MLLAGDLGSTKTNLVNCSKERMLQPVMVARYARADEGQIELLRFLHARFGHASSERVCSGNRHSEHLRLLLASGFADERMSRVLDKRYARGGSTEHAHGPQRGRGASGACAHRTSQDNGPADVPGRRRVAMETGARE